MSDDQQVGEAVVADLRKGLQAIYIFIDHPEEFDETFRQGVLEWLKDIIEGLEQVPDCQHVWHYPVDDGGGGNPQPKDRCAKCGEVTWEDWNERI